MKNECLLKIKEQAIENNQLGVKSLLIFDLDSTLFDVSPRIKNILSDFSRNPQFTSKFPEETKHMRNISVEPSDWGIRSALERLPLNTSLNPDFIKSVTQFWEQRFFNNEYLHHDNPYPGATNFVNFFAPLESVNIVYLSGREFQKMHMGTRKSLMQHGFPCTGHRTYIALKPHNRITDHAFKTEWFKSIDIDSYRNIWFFENDPKNIIEVNKDFPEVEIIFFESTHSGQHEEPKHLPKIQDYL